MNIHSFARGKIMKFLIIGGFCAMLMFVVLMATNLVSAGVKEDIINGVTNAVLAPISVPINVLFIGIPYLLGMYAGFFILAFSTVLDWLFWMNTNVLPDQFGMIKTGFGITLSIANFMFVIALISIAFATILNVQEYNAKKMLGKVIVAAVAVNFSYLIVGFMLDLSHILTQYFMSGGGISSWSSMFGTVFQPQKFLQFPDIPNLITGIASPDWWKMVIGAISGAMFTWIMALVVISFAMMFLARYVHLVFLIILMPLAWALPLFPNMGEMGKKWWSKFTEQLIFLPASTFFVYLSVKMITTLNAGQSHSLAGSFNPVSQGWGNAGSAGNWLLAPQAIIQLLLPCAFLIASLIVAKSLGGSTASFGIKWGGKIASKLMGGVGKYAMRNKAVGNTLAKGFNGVNAGLSKFNVLNKIPGIKKIPGINGLPNMKENQSLEQLAKGAVGGAGSGLHHKIMGREGWVRDIARETGLTGLASSGEEFGSSVKARSEEFAKMDHHEQDLVLKSLGSQDEETKAGILDYLAKNGQMNRIKNEDADKEKGEVLGLINARIATNPKLNDMEERGKDEQIRQALARRPELAKEVLGQNPATWATENMDRKEFQNISKHSLADEAFLGALSPTERAAIASKNSDNENIITSFTKQELKTALEKSANDLTASITSALSGIDTEIADLETKKKAIPSFLIDNSPETKAKRDANDASLTAKRLERTNKEAEIRGKAAEATSLAGGLESIRLAIVSLKKGRDDAQKDLREKFLTATPADKKTLADTLKDASDKLSAKIKEGGVQLESIKSSNIAKSDPAIRSMINVLERIEKNTGSLAARDKAEDKHGSKKEAELSWWVKQAMGIVGEKGSGGGHKAEHH